MPARQGQCQHGTGMPGMCTAHPGTASDTKQHHPSPKPTRMGTSIPIPAGKHPGFNRMGPASFTLNTKPLYVGTGGVQQSRAPPGCRDLNNASPLQNLGLGVDSSFFPFFFLI